MGKVTGRQPKEAAELIAPLVGLSDSGLDHAARKQLHQQQQARAEQEHKQAEQQRRKAARRATSISADIKQGISPYLERKALSGLPMPLTQRVIAVGELTYQPGSLVVPLRDEAGGTG